ncbi:hypothetical protein [Plantactinospora sp. GCM10030261]
MMAVALGVLLVRRRRAARAVPVATDPATPKAADRAPAEATRPGADR